MNPSRATSLNRRALTSLFMFCSVALLMPSGMMLHLFASALFQPTLHLLMTVHNTAAVIFVSSAVIHVVFNWKTMSKYMLSKAARWMVFKRELVISAVGVAGLIALTASHVFHLH